jgi:peptidoglycan/LPS O-acetylase OafA/YrhL
MKYVPQFDGVRAVAILCVLMDHTTTNTGVWYLGVDIFFVLSGYLITSLLLEEQRATGHINIPAFYLRRARRILPALFGMLTFAVLVQAAPIHAALMASVFLGNVLAPHEMEGLSHTWSLAVEEHFYALWPLVFLLRGRTSILVTVIVAALGIRVASISMGDNYFAYKATPARLDSIAIGCLCALYPRLFVTRYPVVAATLIGLAFAYVHPRTMNGYGMTVFALLVAGTIAGIVAGHFKWLAAAPLRYVGTRSYGIYLYHFPIFTVMTTTPTAMKIALTFIAAEISFRTIEAYFRAQRRTLEPVPESPAA